MNLKSWMIIALSLLFTTISPELANGQAFERGYQAFQRGDYRKAKKFLSQGIRKTRDRYDKALMYKLLGISEYNLGRKSAAMSHFKKAIRLDPAIRISRSETRNRSIINAFKRLKRGGKGRSVSRSRGRAPSFRSARRGRSAARRRSRGGNQTSFVTNLLPFGIPQFMQGKPVTGAIFAAGQAAGLLIFFERSNAANTADQEALTVIQDQDASGEYDQGEFDAYIDANEAFVLKARDEATTGLLLFGGLYAAGAVEAMINQPKKSRRRRAEIQPNNDNQLLANNEEVVESIYTAPKTQDQSGLRWGLLPDKDGVKGMVTWKMEF